MSEPVPKPSTAHGPVAVTVDLPATPPVGEQLTLPTVTPAVAPGRSFGDYELLGEIERGGMGVVYQARERRSGRLVALKMMLGDSAFDPADLRRFELEARAAGELSHVGIVAVHAWGVEQGHPFYTMDYVPGTPLHKLLAAGPLAADRAVRVLLGIARAVAVAHAHGIVHRDLKPSNVILDPSGQPRVLDFGLAKRRRAGASRDEEIADALPADAPMPSGSSIVTEKGAILGTPSYMAPEQARGEHERLGPAADVYALGSIFYEMLAGRPPFHGASVLDTLTQLLNDAPPSLRKLCPHVPAALEAVCRRCLAKDPAHRYASAGALADDLERRWQQTTHGHRYGRLALAAGGAVLLLTVFEWGLGRVGMSLFVVGQTFQEGASAGGPIARQTAFAFGLLAGAFVLYVVPMLARGALLLWLGAWAWHAARPWLVYAASAGLLGATGLAFAADVDPLTVWYLLACGLLAPAAAVASGWWHEKHVLDAAPPAADPYLHRLFAVRGEPDLENASQEVPKGVDLADVELGKTLHDSATCFVGRGRQKSLDRAVLIWIDKQPAAADAPAPGVVVRHAHVLNLHAVGSGPEGRALITEPAAATSLAEFLDAGRIGPLDAVELLARIARAVQAFHDQGACHGRLSAEWVLVHGEQEPLLCPCGFPSQSADDRARDLAALGRLLNEWLPPRPPHWQRQARAVLYQVCDAAARGDYARAADFADDLERAVRLTHARWRERLANAITVVLFLLPVLALLGGYLPASVAGDGETGVGPLALLRGLGMWAAQSFFLMLVPGALLLGFTHGRGVVQRWRHQLHGVERARMLGRPTWRALGWVALMAVPAGLWAGVGPLPVEAEVSRQAGVGLALLGSVLLIGFWLLGVAVAAAAAFGERVVSSLQE